jgi:hypothetical protein
MQPSQDRDRCAAIFRQDVRGRKVPAEIHLAVRDHTGSDTRFFSIGPA